MQSDLSEEAAIDHSYKGAKTRRNLFMDSFVGDDRPRKIRNGESYGCRRAEDIVMFVVWETFNGKFE